ncbi:hypothetical protein NXW75_12500 [Bacteroides xylanisolvens]|nr:hypothetical protein [Bacteroides xylanisolvens]
MRSTAPQTSHNLSLTGGTEKVKYYMSIGYMDQGGIIRSGDLELPTLQRPFQPERGSG